MIHPEYTSRQLLWSSRAGSNLSRRPRTTKDTFGTHWSCRRYQQIFSCSTRTTLKPHGQPGRLCSQHHNGSAQDVDQNTNISVHCLPFRQTRSATLYASRGTWSYGQWRGHRRRAGWREEEACGWLKVWYCSWHSLIFQKFSNYGILSIWHQDSNSSQVHPARDDSRLICDCLTHSYYRFVAHQFDRFNIFARTSSMLQQLHLQVLNLSMQPPSPSPISQATCCVCRK
jgi:hypothetical protein